MLHMKLLVIKNSYYLLLIPFISVCIYIYIYIYNVNSQMPVSRLQITLFGILGVT